MRVYNVSRNIRVLTTVKEESRLRGNDGDFVSLPSREVADPKTRVKKGHPDGNEAQK